MAITCVITYQLDPFGKDAFKRYAEVWHETIPACGAELIGYFGPHEGSATTAYGIYNIDSLAAYESYRAKLAVDPQARENHDFARRERFILREDRIFLKALCGPYTTR